MHVCLLDNSKTNGPRVFKLSIGKMTLDLDILQKIMVWGQKVIAQGHGVAKHIYVIECPAWVCTLSSDSRWWNDVYLLQNDDLHVTVGHIRPLTLTLDIPQATVIQEHWCHKPVNSSLVEDPTIRLPGFDLHRRQWSLLNRFRTGQGHCNACHKKRSFTDNELCDCGETQTMSHIVNSCPLTKFDGGLLRLYEADEAAVNWLTTWLLAYDNNNEVESDYTRAREVCSSSTIAGLVGSHHRAKEREVTCLDARIPS